MPARTIMFQGTASHVGKSILTAAFCRILSRRGIRVAPFKGMNMSNNAWVTRDGGEMATAQAVQARACGVTPAVEMNPVLLKTTSDRASQVIVMGKPIGTVAAADLRKIRGRLMEAVRTALRRLLDSYEFVVIEGAGSPAEVNLQETDLANMRVAQIAETPVILVGDIERGGIFAQMVGTLELLSPEDRQRVKGMVINKFRGDPALLEEGVQWLEQRTGLPVFGVLPFLHDLRIPQEDTLGVDAVPSPTRPFAHSPLRVQILRTPTMANFTDFDPLHQEPGVEITYLTEPPPEGPLPHLLILPGSKSTMADLEWLRRTGLDRHVAECAKNQVEVLGICGGFQMLGETIYDPSHVESTQDSMPGLGLLPTSTLFLNPKVTAQVKGIHLDSGSRVTGYEIHAGRLQGAWRRVPGLGRPLALPRSRHFLRPPAWRRVPGLGRGRPVFRLQERAGSPVDELDGCCVEGRTVWGTYLHGLFDEPEFRRWFLDHLRDRYDVPRPPSVRRTELDPYDELADAVSRHLRVDEMLEEAAWIPSA